MKMMWKSIRNIIKLKANNDSNTTAISSREALGLMTLFK